MWEKAWQNDLASCTWSCHYWATMISDGIRSSTALSFLPSFHYLSFIFRMDGAHVPDKGLLSSWGLGGGWFVSDHYLLNLWKKKSQKLISTQA